MIDLITELAELLVQDNAILFVGSGLRYEQDKQPSINQIAEALAQRIAYKRSDRSLSAVARDFEVQHGRRALIFALREELAKLPRQPAPIHQLIADLLLPTTKVITTRFDQILEQALDQFQKDYVVILRDTDVPFFDHSKITLIKMQGDIQQPDSLIITQDDLNDFINKLPTLSDVIRAFFATKTLIFLGYDLSSDLFKRFFGQVNRNVTVFSRTAYAIVPKLPDEVESSYWQKQNMKICPYEPLPFLEALSKRVQKAISRPSTDSFHALKWAEATLPARPYKGLESFTADDTLIFVGRVEESQRLTNRILAHRLMVFYGESGSGKTSLLRAGVCPWLAKQRALCVMAVPAPEQPLPEVIFRELVAAGQKAGLEPPVTDNVSAIIRAWQRMLNGPIVLVVDQFEQLFLAYDSKEREAAAAFLQQLEKDRSLNVRLVLTLREDFLGRLQTLSTWLPDILSVRFRLERLGREGAQAAIEQPAALFKVTWESRLVQQLLDALYERAGGGISPAQLQIVCQRLYEEVEQERSGISSTQITLALFERLGGTAKILGHYLDETLKKLPSAQQPLAWELLTVLVSSTGVKQRLPLSDLAHSTNIEPSEAQVILEQLRNQRLVHRYLVSSNKREARLEYELTHDYLAIHIADSLDASFWVLQKAREIVRQALPEWQRENALLPPDKLRFVGQQREGLRLSQKEVEMIYAAAVTYEKQPEQWEALLPVSARRELLQKLLQHTEPAIRLLTPRHLANVANAAVAFALTETYLTDTVPEVREAALEAMIMASRTHPNVAQVAIERLVAVRNDPASASLARQGIVRLRNQQPFIHDLLPERLRPPVQRQVWRMRWQRNQQRIRTARSRGTRGGLWGFGLGMALLFTILLDPNICQSRHLNIWAFLQLGIIGFALTGLFGGVIAGITAFVQVVLQALQDIERPWHVWTVTTSVGTLLMGLGFLLIASLQNPSPASAIAGMLIGFALTSVATAPLRLSHRSLHLGLAALAGATGFVLAEQLELILQACSSAPSDFFIGSLAVSYAFFQWGILTIAGVSSGVGFFWGLNSE